MMGFDTITKRKIGFKLPMCSVYRKEKTMLLIIILGLIGCTSSKKQQEPLDKIQNSNPDEEVNPQKKAEETPPSMPKPEKKQAELEPSCQKQIDENPIPQDWNWRKTYLSSYNSNDESSPVIPSSITNFVVDKVVREATRSTLESFDDSNPNFVVANYMILSSVFYYVVMMSPDSDPDMSYIIGSYADWTTEILDKARLELMKPTRLKRVYNLHKEAIIDEIASSGKKGTVKTYLKNVVIPIFREPLSPDVIKLTQNEVYFEQLHTYLESKIKDEACLKYLSDKKWEAFEALKSAEEDYLIIQWRQRRESEGGAPLVKMWGDIFQDIERSLDYTDKEKEIKEKVNSMGATDEDAQILEEMLNDQE